MILLTHLCGIFVTHMGHDLYEKRYRIFTKIIIQGFKNNNPKRYMVNVP